jgi:hypothetical protein
MLHRSTTTITVAALSAFAGLLTGRLAFVRSMTAQAPATAASARECPSPEARPEPAWRAQAPAAPSLDPATLRAEIGKAVRDALQDSGQCARADVAAPAVAGAAAPSAESAAAFDEATRIVRDAIAAQQWSEQDRGAIREVLPALAAPQRFELRRRLAAAVNAGQLTMDVRESPF